jgi:hypothetical protein
MKRGRLSAADLSLVPPDTTGTRPTLTPLRKLKGDEKAVFDLVVREHVHLQPIDVPLLMGFARASAGLFKVDSAGDFERLARVAMSFATRLRITPQSRVHPLTLGRRYADQHIGPKPWDRIRDEDDNDDEEDK